MTKPERTWDVFLSYARQEHPFVRAVADEMRQQGVDPWFDELRLQPSRSGLETVADMLASSDVVVVFLGEGLDSPWMNFEIGVAIDREVRAGKRVVPVFLSERARERAPAVLRTRAGIDARHLKPHQVAEQLVEVVGTGLTAPPRS